MIPSPALAFWREAIVLLGLQVGVIVVVAALGSRLRFPVRLRRFLWMATLVGLAGVLLHSAAGWDRRLAGWLRFGPSTPPREVVAVTSSTAIGTGSGLSAVDGGELGWAGARGASGDGVASVPLRGAWWPAWVWMGGAVLAGLRALGPRAWLGWVGWRERGAVREEDRRRVEELAVRLGLGRSVRVVASRHLAGPMAFGVLRPAVGLPASFWTDHAPRQRDVMLAHELSHLGGRDPLWLALADTLCVLLWWHPAVWWARREFRAACETVADEASLVVEDGPAVLADCLVTLAARWRRGGVLGLFGMAGYRSGLGRRVQRLLALQASGSGGVLSQGSRLMVGSLVALAVMVSVWLPAWARSARGELPPNVWWAMGEAVRHWPAATGPAGAAVGEVRPSGGSPALARPGAVEVGGVGALVAREAGAPAVGAAADGLGSLAAAGERVLATEGVPAGEGTPVGAAGGAGLEASRLGSPGLLLTRTYRFNPRRLGQGFGPVDEANATNRSVVEALRRLCTAAGVGGTGANAVEVYPGIASSEQGAEPRYPVFFWSARTSTLMVRATAEDLGVIEQIVEMVNSEPPQVMIEARFVEVTGEESRNLGFDWFLGESRAGSVSLSPAGGKADAEVPLVITAVDGIQVASSRERRGDELDWPGRWATNAASIRVTTVGGPTLQGILTEAQLRVVLRALETRRGVTLLSAPRVTTLSGRQAQIQVVELKTVITGVHPEALRSSPSSTTPLASPFLTVSIPVGPVLDIIPEVAADGVTIHLTVLPSVTEFMGYDDPPKDGKVRIWENGKSRMVEVPLPRFRLRQMQTAMNVLDGQTLVLGGMVTEDPEVGENGKPRRDGRKVRKQLLVLVTPTLVDPAGHRVHGP